MFVASNLYRYATGTNSTPGPSSSAANTRVKRRPNKRPTPTGPATVSNEGTSPPPSYASVAAGATPEEQKQANAAKYAIIETLIQEEDLYKLLGVKKSAKVDEVRRGFLNRSRICHPDKFQNYPPATEAFQKVSFAYEILSKPTSRRMYDVSGRTDISMAVNNDANGNTDDAGLADDTLNGVLYSVLCEFMEGDFEMIGVMINALNEGNPSMNLGDDAVHSIEGALRRLREAVLAGRKYLSIIKFELMRMYEIQQSLRQLSYFNITGRLKLTLQLARVTINIPLAIDQAMKTGTTGEDERRGGANGNGEAADEYSSSSSDSESESETEERPSSSWRTASNQTPEEADFGISPEDDNHNDNDDGDGDHDTVAEERARARRRAKRARRRAAKRDKRAKLRGAAANGSDPSEQQHSSSPSDQQQQQKQLQRRGLLPQTAVGLLKGVAMVLETSESWMPGGGVPSHASSS